MRFLVKRRRVSERRACLLVKRHRTTQGYAAAAEYELRLVARTIELAAPYLRSGFRRIWALLRSEG